MEKFKKIFVGSVMFTTILTMCAVAAPVGATASAGDLIKMAGLSSVYYLAANGKRYVFPNEQTYFSWYSDFSSVVTIPQSELESYPLGANVTIRPGTKLVKITTDPKVYAVEPSGKLLWVPSEAVASTLFGSLWAKRIVDAPDAFFTNYTVESGQALATAYPIGSLVKWTGASDVYYINASGQAQKVANEAAFLANRFKWADVISAPASVVKPTAGTDIAAAVATLIDTSSGAGGTALAGTGLTVALASDTPASATVITDVTGTTGNGQAYVPFIKINFTASPDGDVKVTQLKLKRLGISADADLDNLFLYDGATRLTDGSGISSNYTTFNNASGLFTVTKGTTKSITVKGDMYYAATSGKTIGFSLVAVTDIKTDGAAVSGSFPMNGNLMSTANATDLGKVTFGGYSDQPASATATINASDDQEVFRFTMTSTNQALSVERLKLTAVGSIQLTDLKNFKLYVSGSQVGSTVTDMITGNIVNFDLSASPLAIPKGSQRVVSLRADIKNGSTRTFYFSFQNQNDIVVKDAGYNVYIEPYAAGTFTIIMPDDGVYTISSGELSISRSTASPTTAVAVDATNVVLGVFDFTASGEDMKVQNIDAKATVSTYGGILNGKIYLNDVQVGTTKNLTQATDINFTFGSTFIVAAGTTAKVKIIGDIKTTTSTSFTGGQTVTTYIAASSNNVQRMTSLGTVSRPATDTAGNALTITSAALAVTKYVGFGNQTVVAGSNNVLLGAFVVGAGSADAVNVNSITVAFTTAALNYASVTNMYLKDAVTGVQLGDIKVTPTASNIYTVNFNLPVSGSKVINVYANIKASCNDGPWVANIDADGTGVSTSVAVTATETDIQTMTVGTGTLTAINGSQPDSAILLAGSTGNSVAQFSFSAGNEGFTIDKIKLKVTNNFATSTASITLKYNDKDGVQKSQQGLFTAGTHGYATATYTGMTMYVPANSSASVDVYLDLTSIAYGAASGASSAVYLDYEEGFNATGDSGAVKTITGAATAADLNGSTFYVRKTKPTFAKLEAGTDPTAKVFRFSVVADAAGNVDIKQLGFTVVTSECKVVDMYLLEPNTSTQLTDTKMTVDGSGNVRLIVGRDDDDVLTIGTTPKTYEVVGTVTLFGASGDSINARFKQDTNGVTNGTAYAKGADLAANAADKYNVWSDKSASAHTTATTDWTNGYLIKDMTTSQSFSR